MSTLLKNRYGFTLAEMLVVIVIISLLIALVGPKIFERVEQARRVAAEAQISNFENAIRIFKLDNAFYPTTDQGLEALVVIPTTSPIPKKWKEGGYLEKGQVPLDPWGNPFVYVSPGIHNKDFVDIESFGADGEDGGEKDAQDIENWKEEKTR